MSINSFHLSAQFLLPLMWRQAVMEFQGDYIGMAIWYWRREDTFLFKKELRFFIILDKRIFLWATLIFLKKKHERDYGFNDKCQMNLDFLTN